ncbi:OmpA family protein [Allomuricauda sp. d1]|uniref:OmpA family protein n=1 Tax=Allomuricauda sp. d1 TaxID=3136725 RepID=UPI0031DDB2F5
MVRILVIFFLIGTSLVSSQNLVKNPSFESYSKCPNALGTFNFHVDNWSTPTDGTTDYFNTCSEVMGAPENFNGVQHPKFGEAYAGLYFYAPADYREYIQIELKRMLRKGTKYELIFYISLAEGSDFAVKDFGVLFSYQSIEIQTKKNLSKGQLYKNRGNKHYSLEINHPEFHEDKSDWLKVSTVIEAKGFEKYLVLGNLRDNAATRKIQTKRRESKRGAYYYIDMVSLARIGADDDHTENFELERRYVFEHVLFEFDDFTIQDQAEEKIAMVVEYIKAQNVLITIHGHTDNQGTADYNKKLSLQRAKAIADFLVDAGVPAALVSTVGHGSKSPIATNDSPEGRQKNRRAEFEFVKAQNK